jgi:SAM-dependent methyltransferase
MVTDAWPPKAKQEYFRPPKVPKDLMRYTCGHEDRREYERSGFEVASMLTLASLKHFGCTVDELGRVLDFGCGAGRLIPYLKPLRMTGCDVNQLLIDFCRAAFDGPNFEAIDPMPPLPFATASFDAVVSFSVFSHLNEPTERAWLEELHRVGSDNCVYMLSVQGDWMIEQTLGNEAEVAWQEGFYFRTVHQRHGNALDFPSYYESSYHTSSYIRQEWSPYFDIVEIIKGDDPKRYLPAGITFEEQGYATIRPMGQDLVVARKRT